MPIVFVHGVATRSGHRYARNLALRDAYFRENLGAAVLDTPGATRPIRNPYWGDWGGRLRWQGASMPLTDVEALGSEDDPYLTLQASADPMGEAGDANAAVLTVARRSLPDAVDLLWSAAALDDQVDPAALAAAGSRAQRYALAHPAPPWLGAARDDRDLLARLQRAIEEDSPDAASGTGDSDEEWESLGLREGWNAIVGAAGRLRVAASALVGRAAADRIRPAAVPPLVGFLGDVFTYLHEQNATVREIADIVETDVRAAAAERTSTDPLVVVAHSMGGNIVYDLLTSRAADVDVDLFVTVGSQVALFEELKLFGSSDGSIPGATRNRVPRPAAIARWINVFDYSDLLGFAAAGVFDGVDDYSYRTGSLLKAHGSYFVQPGFHERLAVRASAAMKT